MNELQTNFISEFGWCIQNKLAYRLFAHSQYTCELIRWNASGPVSTISHGSLVIISTTAMWKNDKGKPTISHKGSVKSQLRVIAKLSPFTSPVGLEVGQILLY